MDRPPRLSRAAVAAACGGLLLAGYGAFLLHHAVTSVGGSDVYSYVSAGRALAEGRVLRKVAALEELGLAPELDRLFIPLGAAPGREAGTMVSVVPVGVPLHMAAAAKLASVERGPFLVSPMAAVATLGMLFLIGRELGLSAAWSLAGPAILAAFPGFLHAAVMPMSDGVATFWACAAMLAALRARKRIGVSALAGAAFAVGFLVRPTNALLIVPLLLALPARWRAWRLFVFGAAGPALAGVGYNLAAFGRPFASGYGSIWGELSPRFLPDRMRHYAGWIWRLGSPLLLLGWFGCVVHKGIAVRDRLLLLSWFGVLFLFYGCLSFEETGWHTRYLLPGIPAVILGALLLGALLLRRDLVRQALAAAGLALILIVEIRFVAKNRVHKAYKLETLYPEAARFAAERVPARSLVLTMQMSGSLDYYTNLRSVMWNWLPPSGPPEALLRRAKEMGFSWYGLLAPFERDDARARMPGSWEEMGTVGDITLWKIEPRGGDQP